jgi:hypothetical protein
VSLKSTRMLPALCLAFATLLSVSPASATNNYRVEATMEFGRRDLETAFFGTINYDRPGPGIEGCPGSTERLSRKFSLRVGAGQGAGGVVRRRRR